MSDLNELHKKILDGMDYTKEVTVQYGEDEEYTVNIRQLKDTEYNEIVFNDAVDMDEVKEMIDESDATEDEIERYQELENKKKETSEDLTEDEEEEFRKLKEKLETESGKITQYLAKNAFEEVHDAGKKAVVPDDEDIEYAMNLPIKQQKEIYGSVLNTREEAKEAVKKRFQKDLDKSSKMISFNLGLQAFYLTVGNEER